MGFLYHTPPQGSETTEEKNGKTVRARDERKWSKKKISSVHDGGAALMSSQHNLHMIKPVSLPAWMGDEAYQPQTTAEEPVTVDSF